jgi:serine/threonine protein kinase
MSLSSGTKLGPYEILSKIGAGGMGEVYRARDTRLERTVAIKVLPSEFSRHDELRKRLEREARTLSSLAHPHICSLYDIGQQNGTDFLVMEYLEGETLAHRLLKGALPAGQVIQYGIEIADALERAHRHGIIHRDLKPGNIMLTKDGAKLLDFGLARVEAPAHLNETVSLLEETQDQKLTEKGVVLGTFQYMAPEQLEGKEADARTDIFALGALIYEMATGKTAFSGNNRTSLITAILASEPPAMTSLQPLTPPALERVVKTCLAKDPDSRWQSAQDLKLQLEWIAEGGSQAGVPAPVAARRRSREQFAWALAALLAVTSIGLGIAHYQRIPTTPVVTRFSVIPPAGRSFNEFGTAAVSPDGRKLVFVSSDSEGKTSLWLRPLDSISARELPGTESAGDLVPVWLPDSRFLLFVAEGKLKKTDTMGGMPDLLCDVKEMSLGISSSNGTALLAYDSSEKPAPVRQLNLEDCSIRPVTKSLAGYDFGIQWPSLLPDGKHFVYAGLRTDKRQDVLLGSLASEPSQVLVRNASDPKYAPPGYLFFERNGYLFAQPFDLSKLRLMSEPLQVIPQQLVFSGMAGFASYDVSNTGVLVYQEQAEIRNTLVLRDSTGKQLETVVSDSGAWSDVRLAPNRKKLLATKSNMQNHTSDLWTYDLQRKSWERFSLESSPTGQIGVWSADGQTIVYVARIKDNFILYRKPVDRSRDSEALLATSLYSQPTDWSPDGRFLLYTQSGTVISNIWVLPLEGDRKPFPLAESQFDQGGGRFSPDGHWVAYRSDESGRAEIYLTPFPGSGRKWQISTGGGHGPVWSHDGKKIYYVRLDKRLVEVPVSLGTVVKVGTSRDLFTMPENSEGDLVADGKFLINEQIGQGSLPLTVVLNWDAAIGFNK